MNNNQTDYGKVAYRETQNIHRKLAQESKLFNFQTKKESKQNFNHTSGEVLQVSFLAQSNTPIQLQLNALSSGVNAFKVSVYHNNAKLFSQTVSVMQWNILFTLFSYEQNNITVEVESETEINFSQFEIVLIGEFESSKITYNDVLMETNNQTGEITLLCNYNNLQHLFNYNNLLDLFNNFNTQQTSLTTMQTVWQMARAKTKIGSSYYDDELFFLKQKSGEVGLFLSNLTGSLECKVSNTVPNFAILLPVQNQNFVFLVYELVGHNLTLFAYNSMLEMVHTQTFLMKNNVKKMIPIFNKSTEENLSANFIVVTTQNEVNLISNTFYPEFTEFRMGLNNSFIGKGGDAYCVYHNQMLHCFLSNNNKITYSEFEHLPLRNLFKRIKTTENWNAILGFYHPSEQPFYLYDDHFSWQAEYD